MCYPKIMMGGDNKCHRLLKKESKPSDDKTVVVWSLILSFLIPVYFTYNHDAPNILSEHKGWLFRPISLIAAYLFKQITSYGDVVDLRILPISIDSTRIQTFVSL